MCGISGAYLFFGTHVAITYFLSHDADGAGDTGEPTACPVIANVCMEYFEELALGGQCPTPTPWLKRYVNDVISIV